MGDSTLETSDKQIVVRINVSDIPKGRTLDPQIYETYVQAKLIGAGMPIGSDGLVQRGYVRRYDDPEDFGVTVWEWNP